MVQAVIDEGYEYLGKEKVTIRMVPKADIQDCRSKHRKERAVIGCYSPGHFKDGSSLIRIASDLKDDDKTHLVVLHEIVHCVLHENDILVSGVHHKGENIPIFTRIWGASAVNLSRVIPLKRTEVWVQDDDKEAEDGRADAGNDQARCIREGSCWQSHQQDREEDVPHQEDEAGALLLRDRRCVLR